ncbi:arad-like aldolase/epimerase [Polychaeton citri CBS 116435]|uniref:Arad-like aldolase/epimerase n=1 Tax=Polychaeton citri CBS 116435 TaxID=1314669 RepID=A0A9P4Q5C3_9PEZI|nr:arad-like aldolase/epimerase [Polychaeton citri CBS 116435]
MPYSPRVKQSLRDLVTANHILYHYGAVDGFGHVSVRNPDNPATYFISGYLAPALVESEDDLIEYYIDGSAPVDSNASKGYSERFIHGELMKKYPGVNSVVHSHAEDVLPFVLGGSVPLFPVFHMGGFLGKKVPVWDISTLYRDDDIQDMLVRNERLGQGLASAFLADASAKDQTPSEPEGTVVLMKRHGFTTYGKDIATAIYRTLYTQTNARAQTKGMLLQQASSATSATSGEKVLGGLIDVGSTIEPLTARHAEDCRKMNENTQDKAWRLWAREAEVNPLFKNNITLD